VRAKGHPVSNGGVLFFAELPFAFGNVLATMPVLAGGRHRGVAWSLLSCLDAACQNEFASSDDPCGDGEDLYRPLVDWPARPWRPFSRRGARSDFLHACRSACLAPRL